MFDLVLDKALEKVGSGKALALELDISAPELTRFRSGEIGMKINKLHKLLEISGLQITPAVERQNLINAALTFADLYKNKQ
ncbi:MAG: hypothetical protein HN597_14895 [Desulfobacula sp.]|uniref:hypothetical protein n=1 Tax=Desulfobacula sp. TaxID=2593537 RepID=UPI0039B9C0AF|nr:hypothetical protein [Desulfobacula sp.]